MEYILSLLCGGTGWMQMQGKLVKLLRKVGSGMWGSQWDTEDLRGDAGNGNVHVGAESGRMMLRTVKPRSFPIYIKYFINFGLLFRI